MSLSTICRFYLVESLLPNGRGKVFLLHQPPEFDLGNEELESTAPRTLLLNLALRCRLLVAAGIWARQHALPTARAGLRSGEGRLGRHLKYCVVLMTSCFGGGFRDVFSRAAPWISLLRAFINDLKLRSRCPWSIFQYLRAQSTYLWL